MSNDLSPPRVNLNKADLETLAGLPGIGEGLAKRIIEHRETVGAFAEPADVVAVPGISENMYLDFADLVTVSGDDDSPSPADDEVAEEADPAQVEAVGSSNGHITLSEEESEALQQPAEASDEASFVDVPEEADEVTLTAAATEAETVEPTEEAVVLPAESPQPEPAAAQPARGGFWWSFLLLIAGILGGTLLALGILYTVNGTLYIDQHSHVRNLNYQVATLTGQNEALRTEIQILREQMNTLSAERVRPAETAIQSLERNQGGLTNRMDELADDAAGLVTQMAGLEADSVDLAERTTDLGTQMAGLEADSVDLTERTTNLETTASNLEAMSAALEDHIGLLQQRSDQFQATIDQLELDAERFDTFLTGLGQLLQALQGEPAEE